jgi:tetratricopeptide (TPR) repeat protein
MMDQTTAVDLLRQFKAALATRDRRALNGIAHAFIAQRVMLGRQWPAIAQILFQNGELSAANAAMALYADQAVGVPTARYEQAAMAARTGRLVEAQHLLEGIDDTVPDSMSNAYLKGTIALNRGQVEMARRHLTRAVNIDSLSGQSWLSLVMTGDMAGQPALAERLLTLWEQGKRPVPGEDVQLFYAMGKSLDDLRRHGEAGEAFVYGARVRRTASPPVNASASAQGVSEAMAGFDRACLSRLGGQVSVDTSRPIIVTGLPRSGTTLVEQILSSHSDVVGGDEAGFFRIVAQDVGGFSLNALTRWLGAGGQMDVLSQLYLHLASERFGVSGRIVDKSLDAGRYMGLLAVVLPDAPIVWMRRAPLDCAWSIFRTYFARGLDWTWDMEDIARHFREDDVLLAHWKAELGDRLLVVNYEDLVSEPEAWIGRLLDHCGLSREEAVFRPHETERAVTTASVLQVRAPINRKGIGAAAPYRELLQPFVRVYEMGR